MNRRLTLATLALAACSRVGADRGSEQASRPAPDAQVASLKAELERAHAERDAARAQVQSLRAELDQTTSARVARESEWLRYTKAISGLASRAEVTTPAFAPDPTIAVPELPPTSTAPAEASPTAPSEPARGADAAALAAARAHRDHSIFLALRSLFTAERVLVFDLMETGALRDGATGPVVLRTLDEIGRPTGTLCAARMRLEGSRSARTLTIVLEEGYERRGTTKVAFDAHDDDGDATAAAPMRRIVLPDVDPGPWMDAVPELFGSNTSSTVPDDGHWNLVSLRNELNLLLREDAVGGWWRLASLGGVRGSVICDVVIDQLDREGHLERKLFADRMTVLKEDRGVQILLESGAQLRGDRKLPFLDGRYRIFLPRADVMAWSARGVPGLSPPLPR